MRKKAMTALMLSFALAMAPMAGALTVRAEEGTVSGNDAAAASMSGNDAAAASVTEGEAAAASLQAKSGKTTLAAPTTVEWDGVIMTWSEVEAAEGYYAVELYKDGALHFAMQRNYYEDFCIGAEPYINESGTYQFRVKSLSVGNPDNYEDSEWAWSDELIYKRQNELGTTSCRWGNSNTEPGVIYWNPVEGADGYQVSLYWDGSPNWPGVSWSGPYDKPEISTGCDLDSAVLSADMSRVISRRGAGSYWCTVQAISNDIIDHANGAEGPRSEAYKTIAASEVISGIINDALTNNPGSASAALETVKREITNTVLCTAMQIDETVRKQISDLEDAYTAEKNITVSAPAVSDEAKAYLAGDITIVGAGLNAAAGQEVRLDISVSPTKELDHEHPYLDANSVALDIQLISGGSSIKELDVPVTITMPVPAGVDDKKQLLIFHYYYGADGSIYRDTLDPIINGDGTITFSVSHFSTFVFANGNAEADDSDDDYNDEDTTVVIVDVDWNAVGDSIDTAVKAAAGQNVNVLSGTRFTVPASVVSKLAGKKVTLALQTGNGLAFSITGTDVKKANELRITLVSKVGIPDAIRQQVLAGATASRVFGMEDKGSFPFRVNVHLNMGKENAGKLAYLYYYDEASNTMKLAGSFTVNGDGQAMFGISRGDEYIAVVGGKSVSSAAGYVVVTGDTLSGIASRYGTTLKKLLNANPQIKNMNMIYPGQVISIQ